MGGPRGVVRAAACKQIRHTAAGVSPPDDKETLRLGEVGATSVGRGTPWSSMSGTADPTRRQSDGRAGEGEAVG